MAFELLAARLLMPDFGQALDVWAAVISCTLSLLAVGYCCGGRMADWRPRLETLAVVLWAVGLALLLTRLTGRGAAHLSSTWPRSTGVWCAAMLVLAPALVPLGMIEPLLARLLIRDPSRSGTVVGGLLAAVTVGSVPGTVLTALVLIPRIGVARSLVVLGGTTVLLGSAVIACVRRWWIAALGLAAAGVLGVSAWPADHPAETTATGSVLRQVNGLYGDLQVVEGRHGRSLVCNGIVQTAVASSPVGLVPGTLLRGRDYAELIPYFRPRTKKALLIGVGGGLHARGLGAYGIAVRGVEIEPAVVALATEFFGLDCDVTIADGRAFLAATSDRFDAIVLDAFCGGTPAEHLHTREAFTRMADCLTTGGLLAVHLISRPQHPATRAVARTLEAAFPQVTAVRNGLGEELQHVYLFASRETLELLPEQLLTLAGYGFTGQEFFVVDTQSAPVLTDDRTCLAVWACELAAEHRRNSVAGRLVR
jgi:spermidine synthase